MYAGASFLSAAAYRGPDACSIRDGPWRAADPRRDAGLSDHRPYRLITSATRRAARINAASLCAAVAAALRPRESSCRSTRASSIASPTSRIDPSAAAPRSLAKGWMPAVAGMSGAWVSVGKKHCRSIDGRAPGPAVSEAAFGPSRDVATRRRTGHRRATARAIAGAGSYCAPRACANGHVNSGISLLFAR
jgi:hypothetical protein